VVTALQPDDACCERKTIIFRLDGRITRTCRGCFTLQHRRAAKDETRF